MNEPKRRFLERAAFPTPLLASPTPTVIGADTVIVGNIRGRGHFVVSGEIHGDGELEGALHLAVTATWHGTVHADQAIVAGKITGGLIVKDKLEIGYTAVIRGRVSARTIAIAKGAIVDGEIEVTSGTPMVEFEEKREGR
jgi:cytoskeletal protein CcmA (bactofilin family)